MRLDCKFLVVLIVLLCGSAMAGGVPYSIPNAAQGFGSAAYKSVGVNEGNVPVLETDGLLPESMIPSTSSAAVTVRNGCILSNDTDASHDVNVTAGHRVSEADFQTGITLAAEITKRIDAAWSAGDDAGGLDTGTVANTTTYHLWLISNGTTVDALFSTSATSPTMPSGYTLKARIGAVITDGSANILGFVHVGPRTFLLKDPPWDINNTSTATTAATGTLTVPSGVSVEALLNLSAYSAGGYLSVYLRHPDVNDEVPTINTAGPLAQILSWGAGWNSTVARINTNTSSQIKYRASHAGGHFHAATTGWTDISLQ